MYNMQKIPTVKGRYKQWITYYAQNSFRNVQKVLNNLIKGAIFIIAEGRI